MRSRVAVIAFAIVGLTATASAQAGTCEDMIVHEPAYEPGGRVEELAIDGVRIHVLLPPAYRTSDRRYPVLYLLHGFSMNEDSWLDFSDIEASTASMSDEQQAIVVMPGLDAAGFWMDWNEDKPYETLMVERLIPTIDTQYRTIANRAYRAVAGLSAGGISAEMLAGHHPDLFAAMGAFSGTPVDWSDPGAALAVFTIERALWACAGAPPGSAVADPMTEVVRYQDNNALALAPNYGGVAMFFTGGNGVPCDERDVRDIAAPPSPTGTVWQLAEPGMVPGARPFSDALTQAGVPHTAEIRDCGIHSWRYFERDLHTFWPLMVNAFGSGTPVSFDNRRAASHFSVWEWSFRVDPWRAAEFLDVTDASIDGVTLTGSGRTAVTTAPFFGPGDIVTLEGAVERSVVVDPSGRITFRVDLGWPHRHRQYTPTARALEAAGDYWTSRVVTFE